MPGCSAVSEKVTSATLISGPGEEAGREAAGAGASAEGVLEEVWQGGEGGVRVVAEGVGVEEGAEVEAEVDTAMMTWETQWEVLWTLRWVLGRGVACGLGWDEMGLDGVGWDSKGKGFAGQKNAHNQP